jgi:hypothetical protein
MEEFKAMMKLLNDRALNSAIDNVERLMVQRFMEQDKLGVASLCESSPVLITILTLILTCGYT